MTEEKPLRQDATIDEALEAALKALAEIREKLDRGAREAARGSAFPAPP